MREEEKLARDVYITLFERWGVLVFDNVAESEQRHYEAIKTLLDRYGVPDPVTSDAVGSFTNGELSSLYMQLIDKGDDSIADAMYFGATIEELDIVDLKDALAETRKVAYIRHRTDGTPFDSSISRPRSNPCLFQRD